MSSHTPDADKSTEAVNQQTAGEASLPLDAVEPGDVVRCTFTSTAHDRRAKDFPPRAAVVGRVVDVDPSPSHRHRWSWVQLDVDHVTVDGLEVHTARLLCTGPVMDFDAGLLLGGRTHLEHADPLGGDRGDGGRLVADGGSNSHTDVITAQLREADDYTECQFCGYDYVADSGTDTCPFCGAHPETGLAGGDSE